MHRNMARTLKNRASKKPYISPSQLRLVNFETPFSAHLNPTNRWVRLAHEIPWDSIVNVYLNQMNNHKTGASNINPRIVLGSLMVKHMMNISDEETIQMISENLYIQYFLGFDSFTSEAPFDASLFVELRKRMGMEQLNKINDVIYQAAVGKFGVVTEKADNGSDDGEEMEQAPDSTDSVSHGQEEAEENSSVSKNRGRMLVDATACPQDIAYPTDLGILNESREKCEEIIDKLFIRALHGTVKPRTYRETARKDYLNVAKKKKRTRTELKAAIRKQLGYVKRDLKTIDRLLAEMVENPLKEKDRTYLETIRKVYEQQDFMKRNKTHSVPERIVSIHQPHVRPIVRGKEKSNVEFGSKINVSLVDGYAFLDHLSWEAYNEGGHLMESVELYRKRHGCYPAEIMVDRIYCNRENRRMLKELGIKLLGKQLGRPSEKNRVEYNPGDRNPIEGKFGQAKVRYGMDRIKARLKDTSESWVAMILVVMNLVRLAKEAPYFWLLSEMRRLENIFLNIIGEIRYNRLSVILIPGSRLRLFQ